MLFTLITCPANVACHLGQSQKYFENNADLSAPFVLRFWHIFKLPAKLEKVQCSLKINL